MDVTVTGTAWKGTISLATDELTVNHLKRAIERATRIPVADQRLLARGRKLDDANTLASYGIVTGQQVMLQRIASAASVGSPTADSATLSPAATAPPLASASSPIASVSIAAEHATWRDREIARMEAAASTLAKRDASRYDNRRHMTPQLTDQHGKPVHLPATDAAALTEGLLLYARARVVLTRVEAKGAVPSTDAAAVDKRSSRLSFALALLLKADAAFARAEPRYVEMLDNPAQLYLDVVWTYFLLGNLAHLDDAAAYLRRCRKGFERAHGVNLERLHRLKGPDAVEGVLYVRLRLLEGVVALLSGDLGTAERHLRQARAECDLLMPQEADLHAVVVSAAECGVDDVSRGDAVRALRATRDRVPRGVDDGRGDPAAIVAAYEAAQSDRINAAVLWLLEYRDNLTERMHDAARRRADESRARHAGATSSGAFVNMTLVDTIRAMLGPAMEERLICEALRQTDNDVDESVGLLLDDTRHDALAAALDERARERALRKESRAQHAATSAIVDDGAAGAAENTGSKPELAEASGTDASGVSGAAASEAASGDVDDHDGDGDASGSDTDNDESDDDDDDEAMLELAGAVRNDDSGDGIEAALATYDLAPESAAISKYLDSMH